MHGRMQEFVQVGLNFFPLGVNTQHPLGPKNPLENVDFADPRRG